MSPQRVKSSSRYTSIPFPSYRYIPGNSPHPTRDPEGHSYNHPTQPLPPTDPKDWKTTEAYLFGIDLFNAGYFWEAHEAWESVWKNLDPTSAHALFIQGLIQTAAACLKAVMGNRAGVQKLAATSEEKITNVQKKVGNIFMGIDLNLFLETHHQAFHSTDPQLSPFTIELISGDSLPISDFTKNLKE